MRLVATLPSLGKPTNRVAGCARFGLALLVLVAIALAAACSRTRQEKTLAASRPETKAVRLLVAGDVMLGRGQRLTGKEWRAKLDFNKKLPARPDWESIFLPGNNVTSQVHPPG